MIKRIANDSVYVFVTTSEVGLANKDFKILEIYTEDEVTIDETKKVADTYVG